MAITKISVPNDYVLLATTAITTLAVSVDFTSLAGYSEYLVFSSATTTTGSTAIKCEVNSSTDIANYSSGPGTSAFFLLNSTNSQQAAKTGSIIIYDCLKAVPHIVSANTASGVSNKPDMVFFDGNPVTALSIKPTAGTFNSTGTVFLFGRL